MTLHVPPSKSVMKATNEIHSFNCSRRYCDYHLSALSGKPVSATAETLIGVDESVRACKSLHGPV